MDDRLRDLTADAIIRSGGWHQSYARVLLIEHNEQNAIILVDGNGDGAELELEYWHRGDEGCWRGGSTSGHGPLAFLPTFQAWNAGDFVAAVGRAQPYNQVSVAYAGQRHRRLANEFGIWGFVQATTSRDATEVPILANDLPPVE
jgi:hypothetical protein